MILRLGKRMQKKKVLGATKHRERATDSGRLATAVDIYVETAYSQHSFGFNSNRKVVYDRPRRQGFEREKIKLETSKRDA